MDSSLHISEICKSFQSIYKKIASEKGYGFHISTSHYKPQVITSANSFNSSEPDYLVWFQWLHWVNVIFVGIFVSKTEAY